MSPPEMIIGFAPALGRLFLMTRVGLPFAVSTGQSDFPVETRAFWATRFKSPYGLVFFNDAFYAFTVAGVTKAIGTADKASEQIDFGEAVSDITRHWYAGYVHAVYDPQNEAIVFIYSAAYRNEDGWWVSLALPFSLLHNCWMPLMEITKPGRDMVVTGAATIGSHLQFLAGGRGNIDEFSSEESASEESSGEEPVDVERFALSLAARSFNADGPWPWTLVVPGTNLGERKELQNGDILVMMVQTMYSDGEITIDTPTGWEHAPGSPVTNADNVILSVYWKRVNVDEPNLEFTGGSESANGQLWVVRGADDALDPWDDTVSGTGDGDTIAFGELQPADFNTFGLFCLAVNSSLVGIQNQRRWSGTGVEVLIENRETTSTSVGGFATAYGNIPGEGPANVTVEMTESVPFAYWGGSLKRSTTERMQIIGPQTSTSTTTALHPSAFGSFVFAPHGVLPNDIILYFLETLPSETPAIATPGWSAIPNLPVENAGANPTKLTGFWKRISETDELDPTVVLRTSKGLAQIIAVRGVDLAGGSPWDASSTATGTGTSGAITGPTTTEANTLAISAVGSEYNSSLSTTFFTFANAGLGSLTELIDRVTTGSGGASLAVAAGEKAAAGAIGDTDITLGASTPWAGWTGALKPSGGSAPTVVGTASHTSGSDSTGLLYPSLTRDLIGVAEAGDVLVMFVSTDEGAEVPHPTDWEEAPNSPVVNGSSRLHIFWKECGDITVRPQVTGLSDHVVNTNILVRGCIETGDPFDFTNSTSGGTGTAITLPGGTTTEDDEIVVAVVATSRDALATDSTFSAWANADVDGICAQSDRCNSIGAGGGIGLAAGRKLTAGAVGDTTVTQATAVEWCGWVGALKPKA